MPLPAPDSVVVVNDDPYPIHSVVFSRSPFFSRMLNPESPFFRGSVVEIDVNADGWQVARNYIYWVFEQPRHSIVRWFTEAYTNEQLALGIETLSVLLFEDLATDLIQYLDLSEMFVDQLEYFAGVPLLRMIAARTAVAMYSLSMLLVEKDDSGLDEGMIAKIEDDEERQAYPNLAAALRTIPEVVRYEEAPPPITDDNGNIVQPKAGQYLPQIPNLPSPYGGTFGVAMPSVPSRVVLPMVGRVSTTSQLPTLPLRLPTLPSRTPNRPINPTETEIFMVIDNPRLLYKNLRGASLSESLYTILLGSLDNRGLEKWWNYTGGSLSLSRETIQAIYRRIPDKIDIRTLLRNGLYFLIPDWLARRQERYIGHVEEIDLAQVTRFYLDPLEAQALWLVHAGVQDQGSFNLVYRDKIITLLRETGLARLIDLAVRVEETIPPKDRNQSYFTIKDVAYTPILNPDYPDRAIRSQAPEINLDYLATLRRSDQI